MTVVLLLYASSVIAFRLLLERTSAAAFQPRPGRIEPFWRSVGLWVMAVLWLPFFILVCALCVWFWYEDRSS